MGLIMPTNMANFMISESRYIILYYPACSKVAHIYSHQDFIQDFLLGGGGWKLL